MFGETTLQRPRAGSDDRRRGLQLQFRVTKERLDHLLQLSDRFCRWARRKQQFSRVVALRRAMRGLECRQWFAQPFLVEPQRCLRLIERYWKIAQLRGVYVERMCVEGLHVVMGVTSDPRFGPMLMFGVGGTFVDRLHELSYYLAPITEDEALNMLAETRSYALLTEAKGQADFEISTIVGGLQRLSQLATDFPQIKELSIDPYVIGRTCRESMVVDVRITLGREVVVT